MSEWVQLTEVTDEFRHAVDVRTDGIVMFKPGGRSGGARVILRYGPALQVSETPEEIRKLLGIKG